MCSEPQALARADLPTLTRVPWAKNRYTKTYSAVEGKTVAEVLKAALEKLEKSSSSGGEQSAEVAASVRDRLGLKPDAGKNEVVLALSLLESRGQATVSGGGGAFCEAAD